MEITKSTQRFYFIRRSSRTMCGWVRANLIDAMKHMFSNEVVTFPVTHSEVSNFGAIFSMIGGLITSFALIHVSDKAENCWRVLFWSLNTFQPQSKLWTILWLIHQGIAIELLSFVIGRLFWTEQMNSLLALSLVPAITFYLLKIYSWIVIIYVYRLYRAEERKIQFGSQWIRNTLLSLPNARLTLPGPTLDTVQSYERLVDGSELCWRSTSKHDLHMNNTKLRSLSLEMTQASSTEISTSAR